MDAEVKTEIAVEGDLGKSQKRPIDSVIVPSETSANEEVIKKPRIKKKKVAMLLR